jgi:hypothetical protein
MKKIVTKAVALALAIPIVAAVDRYSGITYGSPSYYFVGFAVFLAMIVVVVLAGNLLAGKRNGPGGAARE